MSNKINGSRREAEKVNTASNRLLDAFNKCSTDQEEYEAECQEDGNIETSHCEKDKGKKANQKEDQFT